MLGVEHANNSGYTLRRQFSNTSDDESVGSDSSHLHTSDVEWAYAFDIHLNALFPCIIILRIIQPIFFYCKLNFYFLPIFSQSSKCDGGFKSILCSPGLIHLDGKFPYDDLRSPIPSIIFPDSSKVFIT